MCLCEELVVNFKFIIFYEQMMLRILFLVRCLYTLRVKPAKCTTILLMRGDVGDYSTVIGDMSERNMLSESRTFVRENIWLD